MGCSRTTGVAARSLSNDSRARQFRDCCLCGQDFNQPLKNAKSPVIETKTASSRFNFWHALRWRLNCVTSGTSLYRDHGLSCFSFVFPKSYNCSFVRDDQVDSVVSQKERVQSVHRWPSRYTAKLSSVNRERCATPCFDDRAKNAINQFKGVWNRASSLLLFSVIVLHCTRKIYSTNLIERCLNSFIRVWSFYSFKCNFVFEKDYLDTVAFVCFFFQI